jgi:GNAT superfamily N-acetyltransferase
MAIAIERVGDVGSAAFEALPGEALFAAMDDRVVIGLCGLNVDPYAAATTVGRVRHLYVLVARRGGGVGRRLVETVVEAARDRFDALRLRTHNPAAARLYEALGFRPVDVADCTHVLVLR